MKPLRSSDDPFTFSRAERIVLLLVLLLSGLGLASGYWLPKLWPETSSTQLLVDTAYVAAVNAYVERATHLSDSVDAARATRRAQREAREVAWAAQREQWAQEKIERTQRRQAYLDRKATWADRSSTKGSGWVDYSKSNSSPTDRKFGNASKSAPQTIAYSGPMPALASLDPNTVDSTTLQQLGLGPGLRRRWQKYRAAGGSFIKASDIGKLYGMHDSITQRILPYFAEPQAQTGAVADARSKYSARQKPPPAILEVNKATEEEIEALPGIGAFSARRIMDYRGRLGGFISVAQIGETPGLVDSIFGKVAPFLRVDSSKVFKREINRATKPEELRHPYLNYDAAKRVLAYRKQHGPFRSPADLAKMQSLKPNEVKLMLPYLDFSI